STHLPSSTKGAAAGGVAAAVVAAAAGVAVLAAVVGAALAAGALAVAGAAGAVAAVLVAAGVVGAAVPLSLEWPQAVSASRAAHRIARRFNMGYLGGAGTRDADAQTCRRRIRRRIKAWLRPASAGLPQWPDAGPQRSWPARRCRPYSVSGQSPA